MWRMQVTYYPVVTISGGCLRGLSGGQESPSSGISVEEFQLVFSPAEITVVHIAADDAGHLAVKIKKPGQLVAYPGFDVSMIASHQLSSRLRSSWSLMITSASLSAWVMAASKDETHLSKA